MGAAVEVRHAGPPDRLQVSRVRAKTVEILRRTYRPAPDAYGTREARGARGPDRPPGRILVAVVADTIVGTVEYSLRGDHVHLRDLGVLERQQRCGIARRLVDAISAEAAVCAVPKLSLETIAETGNVAIFERLGFHVVERTHTDRFISPRFDRLTLVRMERPVSRGVSRAEPAARPDP